MLTPVLIAVEANPSTTDYPTAAHVRVRFGSSTDLTAPKSNFRFDLNSGRPATEPPRPKSADIVAKVFLG
jgi:hypothetical protein